MRLTDIHEHHKENCKIKEEIEIMKVKLKNYEVTISKLRKKSKETKNRKNNKVRIK